MEKLLGDRVLFVQGMPVWAFILFPEEEVPNFLDRVFVEEPILVPETHCSELVFREACNDWEGKPIPAQWMLNSISLSLYYSTRENAILYSIFREFPAKYLLKCYREEYLLEEFRQFIPGFTIEQLKAFGK